MNWYMITYTLTDDSKKEMFNMDDAKSEEDAISALSEYWDKKGKSINIKKVICQIR